MYFSNILLLASQSSARRRLLHEAQIPFKIVSQSADERAVNWNIPLPDLLKQLAIHKMNNVCLDDIAKDACIYVLTADTMGQDMHGVIDGKPYDKADAIKKLKSLRNEGVCGTAFCLDKKKWDGSSWIMQERIVECVLAHYVFDIPDCSIEAYLAEMPYLTLSGACCIDGYGAQFLKTVRGSYSAIQGLPMFELRQALQKMSFFNK